MLAGNDVRDGDGASDEHGDSRDRETSPPEPHRSREPRTHGAYPTSGRQPWTRQAGLIQHTSSTVVIDDLRCTCCEDAILGAVRAMDGVSTAELDYASATLHVDFDPAVLDGERVRDAVKQLGYRCDGKAGPTSTGQLAHTARLAPITCGTRHDRMQYELPHTHGGEQHEPPSHEAAHEGHGGVSHDMSDPTVAAAMERDMRNRFFIALVLTIPVVLLSPLSVSSIIVATNAVLLKRESRASSESRQQSPTYRRIDRPQRRPRASRARCGDGASST